MEGYKCCQSYFMGSEIQVTICSCPQWLFFFSRDDISYFDSSLSGEDDWVGPSRQVPGSGQKSPGWNCWAGSEVEQ